MKMAIWETKVLSRLLSGKHDLLNHLRKQLANSTITCRRGSKQSSRVYFRVPETSQVREKLHITARICDVFATVPEEDIEVDCCLYVRRGIIRYLELYSYQGSMPNDNSKVQIWYLREKPPGSGLLYKSKSRDWRYFKEQLNIPA